MTAGLAALRHDHVSADFEGSLRLVEIGDLHDQRDTRAANQLGEGTRIAKGEHHRSRLTLQRPRNRLAVNGPGQEPDPPRPHGPFGDQGQLSIKPVMLAPATAHQAQSPGIRYRSRQRAAGRSAHWRKHDRMLNRQQLGERRPQRHKVIVSFSRGARLAAYRRTVGFVLQRYSLLPALTALDNVIVPVLPYRTGWDKRVRGRKLLAAVGLAGRAQLLAADEAQGASPADRLVPTVDAEPLV